MPARNATGGLNGLFVRLEDLTGESLTVAVSRGEGASAKIGREAWDAFLTARIAVAGWLESVACVPVSPHGIWLRGLVPTEPRTDDVVDGESIGLAYALAMISHIVGVAIPDRVFVTGRITPDGAVFSNDEESMTKLKLESVANLGEDRLVILPRVDYQAAPPELRRKVKGVESLAAAIRLVLPGETAMTKVALTSTIVEHERAGLSEDQRTLGAALWRKCAPGVRYCGSDPLLFLAMSLYFAFCCAHHQACRSPEDWPLLSDKKAVPGFPGAEGFGGFVNAVAESLGKQGMFGVPRDVVVKEIVQAQRTLSRGVPSDYLAGGGRLDVKAFSDHLTGRSVNKPLAEDVAAQVGGRDKLGPSETFQAFESVIRKFSRELAKGPLLEVMGRRSKVFLKAPGAMASEQMIGRGSGLVNMTLGGAWLVRLSYDYLNPLSKSDCPDWYFQAFKIVRKEGKEIPIAERDVPLAQFIEGLRRGIESHGAYALFAEHPFHPRVLWEVLPNAEGKTSNARYPAEKFVLRRFLRALFGNELKTESSERRALLYWSHEMLPTVGPAEEDPLTREAQVDVPRIGDVGVSEYAAFGRTNQYNRFLDVNALGEALSAHKSDASRAGLVIPDIEWGADFAWSTAGRVDEDGRLSVLNARTSAVNTSEFARRQMQMNRLLDAKSASRLNADDLLCIPWWTLRRQGTALDDYLWGRGGEIGTRKNKNSATPLFADPYTWRGIGFATLLAYEATIGAIMLTTLRDLWARTKDTQQRMEYQLSLRECATFIADEFIPVDIPRAVALIRRVQEIVSTGGAETELIQASDRIQRAREIMIDALQELDLKALAHWDG